MRKSKLSVNKAKKDGRDIYLSDVIKLIDWRCCCSICPHLMGVNDMSGGILDAATLCTVNGTCSVLEKRHCETFTKMLPEKIKNIDSLLLERAVQKGIQMPMGLLAA